MRPAYISTNPEARKLEKCLMVCSLSVCPWSGNLSRSKDTILSLLERNRHHLSELQLHQSFGYYRMRWIEEILGAFVELPNARKLRVIMSTLETIFGTTSSALLQSRVDRLEHFEVKLGNKSSASTAGAAIKRMGALTELSVMVSSLDVLEAFLGAAAEHLPRNVNIELHAHHGGDQDVKVPKDKVTSVLNMIKGKKMASLGLTLGGTFATSGMLLPVAGVLDAGGMPALKLIRIDPYYKKKPCY